MKCSDDRSAALTFTRLFPTRQIYLTDFENMTVILESLSIGRSEEEPSG